MSGVVLAETLRRHVMNGAVIAAAVLLAVFGGMASQSAQPASYWPGLVGMLAIVLGAGAIGPEFTSGTLQLILVKPIHRAVYLLSRVTGIVLVVWAAAFIPFAVEVVVRMASGDVPWERLTTSLLNTFADALLSVSLLALLGSLTRSYQNLAIYVFVQILITVTAGILTAKQSFPRVVTALRAIDRNLYPELPFRFDRDWLLLVLSNAAIALVLACFAFRQREVPYGAD